MKYFKQSRKILVKILGLQLSFSENVSFVYIMSASNVRRIAHQILHVNALQNETLFNIYV